MLDKLMNTMTTEELIELIAIAKENKLMFLKCNGVEFQFTPDAYASDKIPVDLEYQQLREEQEEEEQAKRFFSLTGYNQNG